MVGSRTVVQPPSTPPESASASQNASVLWIAVAIALACALLGRLSLMLAIPPGYASPLYPAAGVALAAVLVHGRRMLPAVLLGTFAANLWGEAAHRVDWADIGLAAVISLASALQAWGGAVMIRSRVRQPLTLSEPRDIALFYLFGAFIACAIAATLSSIALGLSGRVVPNDLAFTWLTWWVGDSMGTLVAAPVTLTLIGLPRDDWAHRRLNVGVTLTFATMLVAGMVMLVSHWNEDRTRSNFEREAVGASGVLISQLVEPIRALEAMRSLFVGSEHVTRAEFEQAAHAWTLTTVKTRAVGYIHRVPAGREAAFEREMHASGVPSYRIFERTGMPVMPRTDSLLGNDALPIAYIEPSEGNAAALGLDLHSVEPSRRAIQRAVPADEMISTEGFSLVPHDTASGSVSLVVYQPVYDGPTPATQQERMRLYRGLVFVAIDIERSLKAVMSHVPAYMKLCVVDADTAAPRRLAGEPGCETQRGARLHVEQLPYAGRRLDLRFYSEFGALSKAIGIDAWMFSLVGLVAASVLGALLLAVTGRTRSISVAVRERTAELEQEARERADAETALRMSEQRLRNIFDTMPLGIAYLSSEGVIQQANPRLCDMTGYPPEALFNRRAETLLHAEDRTEAAALLHLLMRGEIPVYTRQVRFVRRSGREIWVRTVVSALRDDAGGTRNIVMAVEDITESLLLEEAERAREAAEASNRAKSEFLSRMSHELRTPLNAMLGFAQLLELDPRHAIDATQREWVGQIQQAGWHLLDMINDILDLSRIEAGTLRLAIEALELPLLLNSTLPMIEASARERRVRLSRDLDPGASFVRGDSTRVKQILTNLLSNAVKYNHDGGSIHVQSRPAGDQVEIVVSDTGLGMTPDQLAELFTPFNRLGRERSQVEGTGIGLVISQRLAQLMGGALTAYSVAGQGSSFVLSLPAVHEAEHEPSGFDAFTSVEPGYHRRLVHYVEDNETNVEVMRGIMAQRPQVRMETSATGLDGLAAITASLPDLILLDMHLPDISGLEVLARLKRQPLTADIPVIAVSADALASQINAALEAGAERYLTKPVSVSELLGVLDDLLGRAETRFG